MANYDIVINEIEALGNFFRKLFSKIFSLKESGATDIQIAAIGNLMKSGIGLNLHDIASLTNEAFLTSLLEKKMTAADLSSMINLLVELATIKNGLPDNYSSSQLLSKALFLEEHLTTNRKMVYLGNVAALDEAKRLLN